MKRAVCVGAMSLITVVACFAQSRNYIVEDPPKSPEEELASFTLPPGFEIQLVVSEPDIHKPMQLAFDEKGRLLVTTSTDYPLGPAEGAEPSDKLMMIEIDGATGRATSVTTVLDGLNIPSGVEALAGGRIILAQAPDILLLHHVDGVVDSRDVIYTGFARDDTHELPNSFTWGVDGWLYGLQGHVNKSDVKDKHGNVTAIHSGNTYRMRPDGSSIEVYAPGMSNPWGLTFDEKYNLYATDCESRPLWQIVQGVAYQGFNQPKAPAGYAPNITEDAHGASGFAGLVYFDAESFPVEYRHCLFLGNPILGRIHRDGFKGDGFTRFADRKPDFIESSDRWFRPVDLELGPDGALYIADWYNSIISHVEVRLDHPARDKSRGRIWRVVNRGTEEERANANRSKQINRQFAGPMATDWSKVDRGALVDAIAHPQTWVRRQATSQLEYRFPRGLGGEMLRIARKRTSNDTKRVEALWLAARMRDANQNALIRATRDSSPLVRAQAARLLGVRMREDGEPRGHSWRSRRFVSALSELIRDSSPDVQLHAIQASTAYVADECTLAILHAPLPAQPDDPLLDHASTVALSAHAKETDILYILAIIAATDMDPVARERLARALASTQHEEAAMALRGMVEHGLVPIDIMAPVIERIVLQYGSAAVNELVAPEKAVRMNIDEVHTYLAALINVLHDRPDMTSTASPAIERLALIAVDHGTADDFRLAAEVTTLFKSAALAPIAERVLHDSALDARARRFAAIGLMRIDFDRYASEISEILGDPNDSVSARRAIAEEVATRSKTPEQVDALLTSIKDAPGEVKLGAVQRLLTQRPGVTLLFDAVDAGKLSPAYLTAPLFDIFVYWAHRDSAITARYDALVARAPSITNENEKTIAALKDSSATFAPDPARGRAVFEKNCMVCHRIGGQGAMRGPNLDGVGNRGIDRLLQDIVTPSRDVDPAFRTTVITTRDGVVMSGLLVRENASQMVLADAEGNETVFPQSDIEEIRKEWISPMPSGFAQVLPNSDLLSLIGYLTSLNVAAGSNN